MAQATKCVLTVFMLILVTMGLASSCGKSNDDGGEKDPYTNEMPPITNKPVSVPTSANCPKGTKITYANFGAIFIGNYCTSCHASELTGAERYGAPTGSDFETYKLLAVHLAGVKSKAGSGKTAMPPGDQVPAEERKLLDEWIDCGAPEGDGI